MAIKLFEHQKDAIEKLRSGSILVGGVGSGKSRTALAYYFIKECEGKIKINDRGGYSPMKKPKDLYIITTAKKRDSLEWEQECCPFLLSKDRSISTNGVAVTVDSWNNITKYIHVRDAFFIFDEQRVVGSGAWVKAFLKVASGNQWILLSATPGDTWLDYVPVFVANGFYKNRTEFIRRHVVYNNFSKFPKIDHYIDVSRMIGFRDQVLVHMKYKSKTVAVEKTIITEFDREKFNSVVLKRWNVYEDKPVKDVGELCYLMRRVVNEDPSRCAEISKILETEPKIIVFYNFNYERELLLQLGASLGVETAQWNGHEHEPVPKTDSWIYIVQYAAGSEGWNCIETNVIVFYSQNYSYKTMVQAAGRIDRLNTPFSSLHYYYLKSASIIDMAISKALDNKHNFNEHRYMDV